LQDAPGRIASEGPVLKRRQDATPTLEQFRRLARPEVPAGRGDPNRVDGAVRFLLFDESGRAQVLDLLEPGVSTTSETERRPAPSHQVKG